MSAIEIETSAHTPDNTPDNTLAHTPGFIRRTAADRPGVAQPVPEREVPALAWGRIMLAAFLLSMGLMAAWEWHWRDFGAQPSYRNSDGAWAEQRRRIEQAEGDATVLIGSSRVLFDVQLDVWQRVNGTRPIQLALEGTSGVVLLEDLAAEQNFTGRLLVGVAPELFFSGLARRADTIKYFHKQGPSQRSGHWLSKHFLEPFFAFDDADFALATVIERQPWPARAGLKSMIKVRKLSVSGPDRSTHMWQKVENDPTYQALARSIWAQRFGKPPPNMDTPEHAQAVIDAQIARAVAAVQTLRARGVRVVFLRAPSAGPYLEYENRVFPRAKTWDVLLAKTGAPGIHFEDHAELQGFTLPEWSHLSAAHAERFTEQLAPMVEREFQSLEGSRPLADAR